MFGKALSIDDQTAESSHKTEAVAQQRLDFFGHGQGHHDVHQHTHVVHEHDPGYWKKKLIWKEGKHFMVLVLIYCMILNTNS